jgi:hypothetical protein
MRCLNIEAIISLESSRICVVDLEIGKLSRADSDAIFSQY